jgi:hypothetical protein
VAVVVSQFILVLKIIYSYWHCGGGGITVYSCFENYYTFSKIFTFSNNQTAKLPNCQYPNNQYPQPILLYLIYLFKF